MDNREERQRDYDQLARDVNLEEITSSQHNREVLRQLRDNDLEHRSLIIESEEAQEVKLMYQTCGVEPHLDRMALN